MKPPSAEKVTEWLSKVKPEVIALCDGAKTLSREVLADIVRLVIKTAAPSSKDMRRPEATSAAMSSILHLEGQKPNSRTVLKNVNRLLANIHFIYDGMEIPEWDGARETAAAVFIGVGSVGEGSSASDRYIVETKLKTGLCAGIITCAVLSRRSLSQFLLKTAGTSKMECAVEEIAGMEATLVVSLNDHGFLQIHEWSCNDTQKRHNRDITGRRRDVMKCVDAPMPCNVCTSTIEECPLAVWFPKPKGD